MWFCLSCYHLSPEGLYCAFCGLTRGRLCPRGHLNAAYVQHCATCGSHRLTRPTTWLPLGWLSRAVTLLLALFVIRWSITHACCVIELVSRGAMWLLCSLTGSTPLAMQRLLAALVAWTLTLLIISWMLPARWGASLRGTLFQGFVLVGRTAMLVGSSVVTRLWRMVCRQ